MTPREYGRRHDMTPEQVRAALRTGEVAGEHDNRGHWVIPDDAPPPAPPSAEAEEETAETPEEEKKKTGADPWDGYDPGEDIAAAPPETGDSGDTGISALCDLVPGVCGGIPALGPYTAAIALWAKLLAFELDARRINSAAARRAALVGIPVGIAVAIIAPWRNRRVRVRQDDATPADSPLSDAPTGPKVDLV